MIHAFTVCVTHSLKTHFLTMRYFFVFAPLVGSAQIITKATFTSAGVLGPNGPTLKQVIESAANTSALSWLINPKVFSVVNGIQYVTIQDSGEYEFVVAGAGYPPIPLLATTNTHGAVITGTTRLESNHILAILVGQQSSCDGGAGGSFVALVPSVGNLSGATPLFVAGGAGGPSGGSFANNFGDASLNTSGVSVGVNSNGQNAGGARGGVAGGGGNASDSCGGGGFWGDAVGTINSSEYGSGVASPNYTLSANNTISGWCTGGLAFVNGGVGGSAGGDPGWGCTSAGGFGGGGASRAYGGGGGGGYSGGAGGTSFAVPLVGPGETGGGGGGSFSSTSTTVTITNQGAGYVVMTPIVAGDAFAKKATDVGAAVGGTIAVLAVLACVVVVYRRVRAARDKRKHQLLEERQDVILWLQDGPTEINWPRAEVTRGNAVKLFAVA